MLTPSNLSQLAGPLILLLHCMAVLNNKQTAFKLCCRFYSNNYNFQETNVTQCSCIFSRYNSCHYLDKKTSFATASNFIRKSFKMPAKNCWLLTFDIIQNYTHGIISQHIRLLWFPEKKLNHSQVTSIWN